MTFFYEGLQGRTSGPPCAGPGRAKGSRLKTRIAGETCVRECEHDHQDQKISGE